MTLENILSEALQLIVARDTLPMHPYAILYRNLIFSKFRYLSDPSYPFRKELKEDLQAFSEPYAFNEKGIVGPYHITQIKNCDTVFGLAHMLDFIDLYQFTRLKKALSYFLHTSFKKLLGKTIKIFHAMSGGLLFRSKLIQAPESAPDPLTIYEIVQIPGNNMDDSCSAFFEHVFHFIHSNHRFLKIFWAC